jgi:hypothetical protein
MSQRGQKEHRHENYYSTKQNAVEVLKRYEAQSHYTNNRDRLAQLSHRRDAPLGCRWRKITAHMGSAAFHLGPAFSF